MAWLLKMTLLVAGIKVAADLYLGWSLTRALNFLNPQPGFIWGWIVAGVLFCFYLLPAIGLVQYASGSNVNLFTYPRPLIYLFWCGFAFSFQLLTWVVITDILKFAVNHGLAINAPLIDRGYGWLILGLSVVILLYTATKMYRHTTTIKTEHIEYPVEQLPAGLSGFRIAHISDIQADTFTGRDKIARYIEQANEQHPDLIVFTGDLITSGTSYIKQAAHELSRADATYGVYVVIGDHDFWAGKENVKAGLDTYENITILDGRNAVIEVDSARIKLTGITNVYSRNAPPSEVRELTGDSGAENAAAVKILASHQVSDLLVANAAANRYDLILGGHTHGGQVRVPVFFKKMAASNLETKYIQGQYREKGMLININSGLGFTLAPVRYNAPPNISIIELNRR